MPKKRKEMLARKSTLLVTRTRYLQYLLAFMLVVFLSALVCLGYFSSKQAKASTGAGESARLSESSPPVLRCVQICEASRSVGISLDSGLCLNNNIQGYSCAVVVNDSGHCPAYFKGAEEIVLDKNCKYLGIRVYKKKGDES